MEYSALCCEIQDERRPAQEAVLAYMKEYTSQLWPGSFGSRIRVSFKSAYLWMVLISACLSESADATVELYGSGATGLMGLGGSDLDLVVICPPCPCPSPNEATKATIDPSHPTATPLALQRLAAHLQSAPGITIEKVRQVERCEGVDERGLMWVHDGREQVIDHTRIPIIKLIAHIHGYQEVAYHTPPMSLNLYILP